MQPQSAGAAAAALSGTIELVPIGDSYLRDGSPNKNQGSETILRVRKTGKNRALLQFDQAELDAALAGQNVSSAHIELEITHNGGGWDSAGRSVGIHRMTALWSELGATWNCADDSNTSNGAPDCPTTAWDMKNSDQWPFAFDPTSMVLVTNETAGVFSIDVTADVRAFVDGSAANLGWILRLVNETQTGHLDFASRESATPPKLIIVPGISEDGGVPPQCIGTRIGGDTYIRQGAPNQNQGGVGMVRVRSSGPNRALVYVDATELTDATAGQTVTLAELKFTVSRNGTNWGDGREVDIHRMLAPWGELTATWNCAADLNIGNQQPDCEGLQAWDMDAEDGTEPYDPTPTDTVIVTNDTLTSLTFDVTSDVQAILGGEPTYGWLIRKREEGQAGLIELVSSEASATAAAQIITCSPGENDGGVTPPEDCRNGVDDDEDGAIDCADTDCQGGGADATCDGVDDDCDGLVDEDFAAEVTDCGDGGCASTGLTSCIDHVFEDSCVPGTPATEDATCDGIDDDCDGILDEDYVSEPTTCGAGLCASTGATSCVGGQVQDSCSAGNPGTIDATCDSIDDDCDGVVDEDYASESTSCGVGACVAVGSTSCVNGQVQDGCVPGVPAPGDIVCNGLDEDCDGLIDEDYVSVSTSCGIGLCTALGATSCVAGQVQDSCIPGAPAPSDAVCDGLDEDCDGVVDEDHILLPTSCGIGACASTGVLSCASGLIVDSCEAGLPAPNDATCNGIDDDCDGNLDEDVVVDDANSCTADFCDPILGVQHDPVPAGTECDDGNVCDGIALCDGSGTCQPGSAPELNDQNPCTIDACDPVAGVTHDLAPEGTACPDWDLCNGEEICDAAGICQPGTTPASGPCLTDGPVARFSTPQELLVTDLRQGASIVSHDGGVPFAASSGAITWPAPGTALTIDLRDDLHTIDRFSVYLTNVSGGSAYIELRASESGTAPEDFEVVYAGDSLGPNQVLSFAPTTARYVQLYAPYGYAQANGFAVYSRARAGGLVSLYEGGAEIVEVSSQYRSATYAISTDSRSWQAQGAINEFFTAKLRDDQPVAINRIYLANDASSPSTNTRDFEIWVSATGIAPEDFTRVLVGTLPQSAARWFLFDPVLAKYVKFIALNNYGFSRASLSQIRVYTPWQGSKFAAFDDKSIRGTSDIVTYAWDFGDGTSSAERNPVHEFPGPGDYPVSLRVTDQNGFYDAYQAIYYAAEPPVADFTWDPVELVQNDNAQITDTSEPGDAPLLNVTFQYFGNQSAVRPPGGGIAFNQRYVSSNLVTLTARDVTNMESTIARNVAVGNLEPTLGGAPEELNLYWGEEWNLGYSWSTFDWGQDNESFTCHWDFGDGRTAAVGESCNYYGNSSLSNPPVELDLRVPNAYAEPGEYSATLTLTDRYMGSAAVTIPVTVAKRQTGLVIEPLEGPVSGLTTVAATIVDTSDGNGRVGGRLVRFTLRDQDVVVTTDAEGRAEAVLDLINGPNNVHAEFAGDDLYFPSEDTKVLPQEIKPPGPDACGTDFVVAFNDNSGGGREAGNYLFLASSVDQVARVAMPSQAIDELVRVPMNGLAEVVLLPETRIDVKGVIDDRVIQITAPFEICVYGLNVNVVSTDAFVALPIDVLGTEYVMSGFGGRPLGTDGPQMTVVAIEDGTEVTIQPSTRFDHYVRLPDGSQVVPDVSSPVTIRLNAYEAMHFGTSGANPTGTRFMATAPVAFFGGNECGYIPTTGYVACDHQVEQFAPVSTWDTHFLAAPFATRESGYFLSIVAAQPGTEIVVNGALVATIGPGESHVIDVDDEDPTLEYAEIQTSGPAQVMQFAKSLTTDNVPGGNADPFMLTVVPSSQWNSDYYVRTIPNYELPATFKQPAVSRQFTNYLNIIARNTEVGGIRLDGEPVPTAFVAIGSSGYSAAQVQVASGEHRISHILPTTPIGVSAYGWGNTESYGYPGDMRMVPLADGCEPSSGPNGDGLDGDCDGRFDEELANGIDDDGDGLIDEDVTFNQPDAVNVPPSAYWQSGSMAEDTTATFALSGFDPNNDPLSYVLTSLPSVGVLSQAGSQVSYTPPAEFNGIVSFTYRANDGELDSGEAIFRIRVISVNDAPEITSTPVTTATEEVEYGYQVTATDIDGENVFTFSLDEAPFGMEIDPSTGWIFWFPDNASTFMTNPVTVRVKDKGGASATQSFAITVTNENDPPAVTSSPLTQGFAGFAYAHTVTAEDPDPLDSVTYSLQMAPAGASIDPDTGVISWIPGANEIGRQTFVVLATDLGGLVGRQTFTVDVEADATPPIAALTATPLLVAPGEATVLQVTATDETGIASITLTIDGVPVTLDAQNQVTFSSIDPGTHQAVLTVTDSSGNALVTKLNIGVLGGGDDGAPVIALTAPSDDQVLTNLHNVLGTVSDGNLLEYTVSARYRDSGERVVLKRGYDPVAGGILGTFDATLLQNGYYDLELRATDTNGNVSQVSRPVRVDGGAKVGVVQLGFVDANLETLGIPLTVVRRYDSRDKREGDYGYGWRLDVRAGSIRHNRPVGDGVSIYTSNAPFSLPCQEQFEQKSHFTEVRLSDREYYLFRPIFANVQPISGACEAEVFFEFVDGSDGVAELVSLEDDLVRATAVSPTNDQRLLPPSRLTVVFTGEIYNPQRFAMTTADGRVFVLSVQNGIEQVQDPNGNAVAFQDGAIIHSDGRGLQLVRDVRGRIERLIDPLANEVSYEYDGEGDLVAVVDQLGGVTQYLYESEIPHHLTGIIDRQGQQVAAMDYTRDGRLRQLCDADGGCARNAYDLQARDWTFFDATDRPIRRKYDDRGNVREETDGLNHTTKYFYDSKDRLISVEDPTGAKTGFGYDPRGNLTRRMEPYEVGEDAADFTTTFEYDTGDRLIRETLPTGGAYAWTHDENGNQRFLTDADENVLLERTYGPRGEVLTETDRFGTVTFTYAPDGQKPATMEGPDGAVTTFTYDAADRLKTRTRGSVVTRHDYDAAGRPRFTDFGNGVTVDYEYGTENQWIALEGPTFGRVERRVSAMGRLLGWTLPNGDSFSRSYDPQGRVRVETDELGNETVYDYDVAGRLESVNDLASGNTTTFARDAGGRAQDITDGLGGVRSMTYYPDGRLKTLSQEVTEQHLVGACSAPPSVRTTAFAYTPVSTTVTDPLQRDTVLIQNLYGLPSETQFFGGTRTSSAFLGQTVRDEAQFFPTRRTDELLRDRTLGYSPKSALESASDLSGSAWQYGYEVTQGGEVVFDVFSGEVSLGLREGREGLQSYRAQDDERQAWPEHEEDGFSHRLRNTQSPEGEVTTWHFNGQGRVESIDYPFAQSETRSYDPQGQLDLVSRPDGTSLDYDLAVSGRELLMSASDGTGRAFTYGPGDRLETMTDATGATTFYYDAAGRYAGHDNATGSLSLTRDALGHVSEQEASAPVLNVAFPTQFAHDEEGRLLWLRDRRGKTAEMRYDEAGRLVWLNHGQRTCSSQSIGPTTEWTYDERDRIESVIHRGPPPSAGVPGPVLLSRTYERNAAGEPTRILEQDGSYTLIDYNPAGRVKTERYFDDVDTLLEEITYGYDLDGNRTQRTSSAGVEVYEYDPGSRLTRVTLDGVETQAFEYDENGRVSRIVRDGLDQRLTWDALDRLTRVEDVNFIEDAVDFAYDGQGRRVSADRADSAQRYVVGPTGNQSLESPHLVHNGFFLTGELVYNGEHALWRYDGSEPPDTRVYLRDAMGSVIGLMDENGQLIESFDYDAFGNVRSPGGEALPEVSFGGDSRFQGMWKDAGTGLYYVRARYYDARTGRFLSRDPAEGRLEEPETLMPYAFANGNPYVFQDPTGRFTLAELAIADSIRNGIAGAQSNLGLSFIDRLQTFRDDTNAIGNGVVADVFLGVAAGAALGGIGRGLWRFLARNVSSGRRATLPRKFYHYTTEAKAGLIQDTQLGQLDGTLYLTPAGGLSPTQAGIELALPQTNTAEAVFEVSIEALDPSKISRFGLVAGNFLGRGGGGYELLYDGTIPRGAFRRVR